MNKYHRLTTYSVILDDLSNYFINLKITVKFFTNWPNQSNKALKNIFIPYFKIIIMRQGSCTISIRNKTYHLEESDVLIVPPFTLHNAETSPKPTDSYEIFFTIDSPTQEYEFINLLNLVSPLHCLNLVTQDAFLHINDLYVNNIDQSRGNYLLIVHSVLNLLAKCHSIPSTFPHTNKYPKEQQIADAVVNYIILNINVHMSISHISADLNYSSSYINHCIKKYFDCTPTHLINKFKMAEAAKQLGNPELSIGDIALSLGYSSVYYFSNVFKKYHHIAPSKFRHQ